MDTKNTKKNRLKQKDDSLINILDKHLANQTRKKKTNMMHELKIPNQFSHPKGSYFSMKSSKGSNNNENWSYSDDDVFYREDINVKIENIKKIYEELLIFLENYIVNWKGNINKKVNDIIDQISIIQIEIVKECKDNDNDICNNYINKYIKELSRYQYRVENIIHKFETIHSPSPASPITNNRNTKKNKKKGINQKKQIKNIKKKATILILNYLLDEIQRNSRMMREI
jgi:hypothetical protein